MPLKKILPPALALLALFLIPIPGLNRPVWRELQDAGHVFVFALLAPLLAQWLQNRPHTRPRRPLVTALQAGALAALAGLAAELLQGLTGRSPSWHDLRNDLAGAAAGLLLQAAWRRRAQRLHALTAAAAAFTLLLAGSWPLWQQLAVQIEARRALPELLGRNTPRGGFNISTNGASLTRTPQGFRLQFHSGSWPGLTFEGWPRDWRDRQALVLDVENPGRDEVTLGITIRDRFDTNEYDNRFNQPFLLPAGARRQLRLPLTRGLRASGGRPLDHANIRSTTLLRGAGHGDTLLLHRISFE